MFTIEEGFYVVYKFLESYWLKVGKYNKYESTDFSLVTIISTMDPENIHRPSPVDRARYQDWLKVISISHRKKDVYTEEEIYTSMLDYLKFYKDEFSFNVERIIIDIETNFKGKYYNIWKEQISILDKELECNSLLGR
jgi:hypothetical protein